MEKKPITRQPSRCVGVRMSVWRGTHRVKQSLAWVERDTASLGAWRFVPYVAPESHAYGLYNVNWIIRVSSGSNRDFNVDWDPSTDTPAFRK